MKEKFDCVPSRGQTPQASGVIPKYMKVLSDGRARFTLRSSLLRHDVVDCFGEAQLDAFMPRSKEDLLVTDEDFVTFQFRAISAAYLGASGFHLDFDPKVLKKSIPLMLPAEKGGERRDFLKFHRNHTQAIQARIGFVQDARWAKASGKQSAPGINVDVGINWKLAPNEIMQLSSEPPLVDSVSIAFDGTFEKSHPDLEDWEFFSVMGHEVDGEIVRVKVTEITAYDHIGLVTEGGDEEADKLSKIENRGSKIEIGNNNKRGEKMEGLQISKTEMAVLAGLLQIDELTSFEDFRTAVTELARDNKKLQAENEQADETVKLFEKVMQTKRDGLKALVAKVDPESAGLQKAIDVMAWDDLTEMEKVYQKKLDKLFAALCQDCGSRNIARRSSLEESSELTVEEMEAGVDESAYQ